MNDFVKRFFESTNFISEDGFTILHVVVILVPLFISLVMAFVILYKRNT